MTDLPTSAEERARWLRSAYALSEAERRLIEDVERLEAECGMMASHSIQQDEHIERLGRELRQWQDMFIAYFGEGDAYAEELRLVEVADKALQDHFADDRMTFAGLERERDALLTWRAVEQHECPICVLGGSCETLRAMVSNRVVQARAVVEEARDSCRACTDEPCIDHVRL